MKNWTEKYRPNTSSEVLGQEPSIHNLREAITRRETILLHGPIGVGKTCSVHAIANDLGYEILEINASDLRDAENIHAIVGESLKQQSLFNKDKIILVDEIDGISGKEDRGGIQALLKLLTLDTHALILIANNPWDQRFSTLRKKCVMIPYKKISYLSITKLLKTICEKEHVAYEEEVLKTLARRAGGDARAAINDLQTSCAGTTSLAQEHILELGEREREQSIIEALRLVFKSKKVENVLGAFDRINCDVDEAILWVEENIPREYTRHEDLVNAFNALSRADIFKGRIRRWQYWRFLTYVIALITVGVALAKKEKYSGFTPYQRTQRILKIWMANQKNMKRNEIAQKVSGLAHCSRKRCVQDYIPYLSFMAKHHHPLHLGLGEEEIEWLQQH